ncbi:hypothetical protein GMORB2_7680 [Geosmithia morbida]|uniref:Uncharacterized protein n=1 Tax=Geosmithia morbida TaxID=1094350 RepID=A0A9P5D0W7_9HYPO|nr:uncharacterized protein GMORB2_7680 [Geosmithia morbida]KAF4122087.1 hypothetical protein GMORB2_7680 [Geosmithia morbida]
MPEVRRSSNVTRTLSGASNAAAAAADAADEPSTPISPTASASVAAAAADQPSNVNSQPSGRVSTSTRLGSLVIQERSHDDSGNARNEDDDDDATATAQHPEQDTIYRAKDETAGGGGGGGGGSSLLPHSSATAADGLPRRSLSYALRPQAEAYYDSRAATRREWRRRGRTLEEYYNDNPDLLPQLPFTWRHGKRRWRLWFFAFIVFVDASAVPIALYFGLKYAGHVEEYIIFAVVTSIWGGPTYVEFAVRTLRLLKKEHFYRPLGSTSRWSSDMTTWASSLAIFVLTVLFIVGSAPHDAWNRVISMAAPSLLWTLGGVLFAITMLHRFNIRAPFRISSTSKGEKVLPGAYYFIEDVMAVNARCGRPYREALAARYRSSPRFRQMLYEQSMFWSVPSLILAAVLTVIAIIPQVPEDWGYGVCWVAPFLWMFVWGCISIRWCKKSMVRERLEWEAGINPDIVNNT